MVFKSKLKKLIASQRGVVGVVEILVIVVVLGGLGFAGYKVMQNQKSKKSTSEVTKQEEPKAAVKLSAKAYENKDLGLTFTPPEGWVESQGGGVVVGFTNPQKDKQGDVELAAGINIAVEQVGKIGLDEYIVAAEKVLATFTDYKQVSKKSITLSDQTPAFVLESTFKQDNYPVHGRQVVVVQGGVAYILSAVTLSEKWTYYQPLLEASQNTFKSL